MIRLVFIVILLCNLAGLSAQRIRIYEGTHAKPLEKVTLTELISGQQTKTDKEGYASLNSFVKDNYLELKLEGYSSIQFIWKGNDTLFFMNSLNIELEEIVVSARRIWEQRHSPSMELVKVQELEKRALQPQTAADLLSVTGRVFVQKSQQGGGSPMIRGFAANRLVYTVDGVRMNTAIFRGGNLQQVISLDPQSIESVEVVMGPGSVIHGSDAIGGAMNFQTIKPQMGKKDSSVAFGQISSRFSSANKEKTHHVHWAQGWEKWALYSGVSYSDFGNLRQGRRGPDDYLKAYYPSFGPEGDEIVIQKDSLLQVPGAYQQLHLLQKVRFQPTENWNFVYSFHFSETSSYGRYDRYQQEVGGNPRFAVWDYGPQVWRMHLLAVEYKQPTFVFDQLDVRLASQHFKESRIDRGWRQSQERNRSEEVNALSLNVDAYKKWGANFLWKYGVEGVSNLVDSRAYERNIYTGERWILPPRYPQALWVSAGIYILNEFRPKPEWNFSWGLRYNETYSKADFGQQLPLLKSQELKNGALTGNIGATWKPHKNWHFRANTGTAFRSPNVDDLGKLFESQQGVVVVPNLNLLPEYAWTHDLGVAVKLGKEWTVEGSVFSTHLIDAMVRRPFQWEGRDSILFDGTLSQVQALQNGAFSRVRGGHIGLEWNPLGFRLQADYNFQKGIEESEGGQIFPTRHTPPSYGRFFAAYTYQSWEFYFWSLFQRERSQEDMPFEEKDKEEIYALDNLGRPYSPHWCTTNAALQYKCGGLAIHLGVENIFDLRYRPYASGISAPGRDFRLTIQYNW
jgi:hemoglobin/transferrin/lactoferrin receptor protein